MARVRKGGAAKWARVASQRTEDYKDGINNPRKPWAESTANAQNSYNQGIQLSIAQGRFATGVQKAGNGKWQNKANTKGVQRYAMGIQESEADYEIGVAPYLAVIEGTQLPPRYPKGDPRNIMRVATIAQALRNKKTGGSR